MQDIIINQLNELCYSTLNSISNNSNYFELFLKVNFISFLFLIFILIIKVIKEKNIKTVYIETRTNIKNIFILFLVNIVTFYFLDDILTEHLLDFTKYFNDIYLWIFTIFVIYIMFKQISQILNFLIYTMIIPFSLKENSFFKKISKNNISIIINTTLLNVFYYVLKDMTNINQIYLLIFLAIIIFSEKTLSYFIEKEHYEINMKTYNTI